MPAELEPRPHDARAVLLLPARDAGVCPAPRRCRPNCPWRPIQRRTAACASCVTRHVPIQRRAARRARSLRRAAALRWQRVALRCAALRAHVPCAHAPCNPRLQRRGALSAWRDAVRPQCALQCAVRCTPRRVGPQRLVRSNATVGTVSTAALPTVCAVGGHKSAAGVRCACCMGNAIVRAPCSSSMRRRCSALQWAALGQGWLCSTAARGRRGTQLRRAARQGLLQRQAAAQPFSSACGNAR